jgi:hypothetical protein
MAADPLLTALDDALKCSRVTRLSWRDRLDIELWWLIERGADELEMPPTEAADQLAMLCELAKGHEGESSAPIAHASEMRPTYHE